jgi:hypothetical protein
VAAPITATKDAVLMTDPPPRSKRYGIPYLQHRKTLFRFTSCTRCQASSPVSRIEASSEGAHVVEEHVQAAEAPGCLPVHALHVVGVGDVSVDVEAVYLRRRLFAGLVGEVHDAHAGPFLGEAPGGLATDAARGAGDDRDLAFEASRHL